MRVTSPTYPQTQQGPSEAGGEGRRVRGLGAANGAWELVLMLEYLELTPGLSLQQPLQLGVLLPWLEPWQRVPDGKDGQQLQMLGLLCISYFHFDYPAFMTLNL